MAGEDDIAVTIEGEGEAGGAETTERSAADDLQAQFDEMKTRAARAESDRAAALQRERQANARAEAAAREVQTARTEVVEREGDSIESGITAANTAIEAAKRDIKTAGEAGDHQAQADAYDRLASARADLALLNRQKADVEIKKTEAARPAPRQETRTEAAPDPVEESLSAMAQTAPRSAQWLRDHREYMTDGKKNAQVRAAHFDAVAEGIEPESDAYFEHIETKVGLRKTAEEKPAPKQDEKRVEVKTHARRAPVAPVNGGDVSNGSGGSVVKLSKRQAEAATDGTIVWNYDDPTGKGRWKRGDPIGHQEMARRVKAQSEQGLYDPNNIAV